MAAIKHWLIRGLIGTGLVSAFLFTFPPAVFVYVERYHNYFKYDPAPDAVTIPVFIGGAILALASLGVLGVMLFSLRRASRWHRFRGRLCKILAGLILPALLSSFLMERPTPPSVFILSNREYVSYTKKNWEIGVATRYCEGHQTTTHSETKREECNIDPLPDKKLEDIRVAAKSGQFIIEVPIYAIAAILSFPIYFQEFLHNSLKVE